MLITIVKVPSIAVVSFAAAVVVVTAAKGLKVRLEQLAPKARSCR